jgi:hypothetical protein
MTCGRGWQAARVAGTHRTPVSFGAGVRAWAAGRRERGNQQGRDRGGASVRHLR